MFAPSLFACSFELTWVQHMMIDFGTGNNNKLNWVLEDKQELIDIIETIYRGAKKGRGLVVSPKDYSTRYRY
jgi:DIM1 family U5 snRNP protein